MNNPMLESSHLFIERRISHYQEMAIVASVKNQPQFVADEKIKLLYSGHKIKGFIVDLYGTCWKFNGEHEVTDIVLSGLGINITALFTPEKVEMLGLWCDDNIKGK